VSERNFAFVFIFILPFLGEQPYPFAIGNATIRAVILQVASRGDGSDE